MATLREIQLALQGKIEELRERDEYIERLEEEVLAREQTIQELQEKVSKYRVILKRLSTSKTASRQGQQASSSTTSKFPVLQQAKPPLVTALSVSTNHDSSTTNHLEAPLFRQSSMQISPTATNTPAAVCLDVKMKDDKSPSPVNERIKEDNANNNTPWISAASKRRLLFLTEKTKSESPFFFKFKNF